MLWRALLLLVPLSIGLALIDAVPRAAVFVVAILAIVPLAEWVRRATERPVAAQNASSSGRITIRSALTPSLTATVCRVNAFVSFSIASENKFVRQNRYRRLPHGKHEFDQENS